MAGDGGGTRDWEDGMGNSDDRPSQVKIEEQEPTSLIVRAIVRHFINARLR